MKILQKKEGILASNNFTDIKHFVDEYQMPLLTSAYMICISVEKRLISKGKASDMWNKMWENGVTLPKSTFEEYYYGGKYKSDFDDFGKRLDMNNIMRVKE